MNVTLAPAAQAESRTTVSTLSRVPPAKCHARAEVTAPAALLLVMVRGCATEAACPEFRTATCPDGDVPG